MADEPFDSLPTEDLEALAKPTDQPTKAQQVEADKQAAEAKAALKKRG